MSLCYTVRRAEATMFLLTCVIGSTSLDDSSTANLQVRLYPTAFTQICLFQSQLEMKNGTKTAGQDEQKNTHRQSTASFPSDFQNRASCLYPHATDLVPSDSLVQKVCEATPPSSISCGQKQTREFMITSYSGIRTGRAY